MKVKWIECEQTPDVICVITETSDMPTKYVHVDSNAQERTIKELRESLGVAQGLADDLLDALERTQARELEVDEALCMAFRRDFDELGFKRHTGIGREEYETAAAEIRKDMAQ